MDRKLSDYYPLFMREVKEIEKLCEAQQPVIESADESILKTIEECFISTATELGISRWEKIMGIKPSGVDGQEERRFRIQLKMGNQDTYTMRQLKKFLEELLGADGYTIDLRNKDYVLKIRVALAVKAKYDEALKYIKEVAPANLIIDMDLLYNQHSALNRFTHGQLKGKTHAEIRREVL